ncbi:hypothetical protein SCHPADRAFT_1001596 [Schizopora paradoxa]|uniref:Uncharacterized protein n=1 Tax=Schizopora paradoxa TaxID=27342 RepID=A0A0H2R6S8_9AGAM|nr:hypothetical protein SCHPADRAFT_1001596 [Schizopora paradoxa]
MSGTEEEIHVHKASDAAVLGGVLAGLASAAMLALIFYVLWRTRKTKTSLPITRTSTLMRQSNSTQTNYEGNLRSMGRSATMSSTKLGFGTGTPPETLPSVTLSLGPGRTTPVRHGSATVVTSADEKV